MNLRAVKRAVVTGAVALAVLEGMQLVLMTLALWKVW